MSTATPEETPQAAPSTPAQDMARLQGKLRAGLATLRPGLLRAIQQLELAVGGLTDRRDYLQRVRERAGDVETKGKALLELLRALKPPKEAKAPDKPFKPKDIPVPLKGTWPERS